nr:alpha-N-acetylglucosaminidase C-terminal domain-containing protein [Allomuricauda aurantiaca]
MGFLNGLFFLGKMDANTPSLHFALILSSFTISGKEKARLKEAKQLYRNKTKLLIYTWTKSDDGLNDYAHREWGGMPKSFYLPR